MLNKIYALVDCNTFYASCERSPIWRPDLKDKPVIVLSNNDGCIVALTKEAKNLGLKRATPVFQNIDVIEKNNVQVFSSNYRLYADVSQRIIENLKSFCDNIENYSVDESFLDLTSFSNRDLNKYAKEIKDKIYQYTKIPISIGVGPTKTMAKLANRVGKKYGCYNGVFNIINHPNIDKVYKNFGVHDVWGIGYRNVFMLNKFGVNTVYDFVNLDDSWVKRKMTIKGLYTLWELRGRSCIEIIKQIPAKQEIMTSRSFGQYATTLKEMREAVAFYATQGALKLRSQRSLCSGLLVFIETNQFAKNKPQYRNFKTINFDTPTNYTPDIIKYAIDGLTQIYKSGFEYKRAGVLLVGLVNEHERQYDLFEDVEHYNKKKAIMGIVDKLNYKHGNYTVNPAGFGRFKSWEMRRDFKSPDYTTSLHDIPTVQIG